MGNKPPANYVQCAQTIQSYAFLSIIPLSFPSRERIAKDVSGFVTRLERIITGCKYMEHVPVQPPTVTPIKVFNETEWFVQWNIFSHILDTFESMEPTQEDCVRALPHLERAVHFLRIGQRRFL
jgi:hypothetical protein